MSTVAKFLKIASGDMAEAKAEEIKGEKSVKEVMEETPKEKRDDVLKALREKSAADADAIGGTPEHKEHHKKLDNKVDDLEEDVEEVEEKVEKKASSGIGSGIGMTTDIGSGIGL